ncbi:MAG: hypothetical protein V4801_37550 [Burkholderia gladioli]
MSKRALPPRSPAPIPPSPKLTRLPFAFPFLRKRQSGAEGPERFTDEREIHRLLAEHESGGAYLASRKGLWHGGIHVTEAGAGERLDLDAGVRCIADGELIAFRANKTYPLSRTTADDGESSTDVPYSTGFALIRHTMTFPRDSTLTFYSLYMHLMSDADYANFPTRDRPSYWPRQWQVTQYAQDVPSPRPNAPRADASQQGLRVRRKPNGLPLGIVPQGAILILGKRKKVHRREWAEITGLPGATLYPAEAGGFVEPVSVVGGWVYVGDENGGAVIEAFVPDSTFDHVIVTIDPESKRGIPIRAGDPVGHLGRYDSLTQRTGPVRMVHIEAFCGEEIESFIEQGCAWANRHGPHPEDWADIGLPADPALLRIASRTVLYQQTDDGEFVPGADSQSNKTDVVGLHAFAELARDSTRSIPELRPHPDPGFPVHWWHVDSVNALGHPIDGWVCDFNFAGGRVTREFAQKWVDFQCIADSHDASHTIFASPRAWLDHASDPAVPETAARSKLSPLMREVYDALFASGDGKRAADELCQLSRVERGGYPWIAQAASRLIVRHESEWANPSKWAALINVLENETGPRPEHEQEQERIESLVWWNEVRAGVPEFPDSNVFHVNPIALVGNFIAEFRFTLRMMEVVFPQAATADIQSLIDELNSHIEFYKLDTPLRRAHFFAQVMQEAGGALCLEEGFVWKASSLIKTFSYFKANPDEAVLHGYDKNRPIKANGDRMTQDDFEAIANGAYGGRADLGNGDYESGDGWTYRGRGAKQLTGRKNYQDFSKWHDLHRKEWPDDVVDFEKNPDALAEPKYAARSAAYFWLDRKLPDIADQGASEAQVDSITEVVNFHTDSYKSRVKNFNKLYEVGVFN